MSTPGPSEENFLPSIGPIPLAAFISICFFAPFFVSFAMWLFYTYTIKRCKTKRRMKEDAEAETKNPEAYVSRHDVEKQVAGFVQAPKPAKTKTRSDVW
jgi:hypothetical protein